MFYSNGESFNVELLPPTTIPVSCICLILTCTIAGLRHAQKGPTGERGVTSVQRYKRDAAPLLLRSVSSQPETGELQLQHGGGQSEK